MAKRNSNRSGSRSDQPIFNSWGESAKERPIATAAVVGAAAAAGAFLWSRRNQISDQLSQLSDQIGEWTDSMRSSGSDQFQSGEFETTGAAGGSSSLAGAGTTASDSSFETTGTGGSSGRKSSGGRGRGGRKSGLSETGGGNASLGAHSGTTGTGGGTI